MMNLQKVDPLEREQGDSEGWHQVQQKRKRRYLVGRTEQECEVETVPRLVSLHVTRLKPNTKPDELKSFLQTNLPSAECEAHPSKRPDIYASAKVTISRELLKKAWRREVWPNGALVSFFARKRMPGIAQDPQNQIHI
ncbi:hypothetical protein JTB14_003744 [Gonioctena quinquepunctata]|nr:hypothetical protein JTB14_003744 [Gonioctena quinquepunctata]